VTVADRAAVHVVHELTEIEDARNGDQAILVVPTDGREAVYRIERWLRVAGAWVIDDEVDLLIKEPS
jgi:hypothetical protein